MDRLLGMPLGTFLKHLFKEPFTTLRTLLIFWRIKLFHGRERLHIYPLDDPDINKRGPNLLPIEKKLEKPQTELSSHLLDSVLIFGGNSSGERLVARVSREQEGNVLWLYIKLASGHVYQVPCQEKSYPPKEDFVAGGLKIRCLVPMRKWRLTFNGLLRETDKDNQQRSVHVKFNFICISTAIPLDLTSDIHPSIMAKFLNNEIGSIWNLDLERYFDKLDRYVQAIYVIGTLTVDQEEELSPNFWGLKHRSKDVQLVEESVSSHLVEVLSYTQDGQIIYGGEYYIPGFRQRFEFGIYMERTALCWPARDCKLDFKRKQPAFNGLKITIQTERRSLIAEVDPPSASMEWNSGVRKGYKAGVHLTSIKTQDGDVGHALVLEHNWSQTKERISQPAWHLPPPGLATRKDGLFLLALEDASCRIPSLSGGKGSSLSALAFLAAKYNTIYKVPKGFVISTKAYTEFFTETRIQDKFLQFEKKARCNDNATVKKACELLVEEVSILKLPKVIQDAIRQQISAQFPGEISSRRFAVRSSASGEDSEEMSAAGQMTTYLGVSGLEKILDAVVKCWASQFSFTAIQYKKQNGQELNAPMAVVVQEMVRADIAGVLFTCDPVTGNPANITLTANYGIGESVVSASAEPDTVVLLRDVDNTATLKAVQLGKKHVKVVMSESGGVVEEHNDLSKRDSSCISNIQSKKLTEVCLKLEEAYGFPVDIEWAFIADQLFLLQARPISTFDKETRYEVAHASDEGVRTERECSSKANIGEVMPTAVSPFGVSYLFPTIKLIKQTLLCGRNKYTFPFSPFTGNFVICLNHGFINMSNLVLRFHVNGEPSFLAESGIIAGFGRLLEDQEIFDQADKRTRMYPLTFVPYQLMFFLADMLLWERWLNQAIKKFRKEKLDLSKCSNSKEMLQYIWDWSNKTVYAATIHFTCTFNSSILNNILMSILRSASNAWDASLFSDLASVLSSCGDVESADIPRSIQEVAAAIKSSIDVSVFKKMAPKDALSWLETTQTPAGKKYAEFLKKHGHRCIMEFDVYSKPWRIEKLPLVKVLQESASISLAEEKVVPSAADVIKNFKTQVTGKSKFLLKIVIPLCRKSVMSREKAKSLWMHQMDAVRKAFWDLSEQLVKEGRLPDNELMFFLSGYEIMDLIETRNPLLVQSAFRRKAIFPVLTELRFPEVCKGVPLPTNVKTKYSQEDFKSDLEIKGTPVSQGVVKAVARVAASLEDAAFIQPGEVLIAYSTDIAWSPYFPLLSGVATELGGLISHGAVVAREYGLPCVVGVSDATLRFKSGDLVLLDGNKGILKRIKPASK